MTRKRSSPHCRDARGVVGAEEVIRSIAAVGLALATALWALATFAAESFRNPTGVAVVIGNAGYQHRDVPEVAYAHRDAAAFRGYVEGVLGYDPANIIELRDATRFDLFDVFGSAHERQSRLWSFLDPDEGSDVVVYYSGHGVPGVNDGRGYLLPVNVDPKAAEADGYPIDLLYEQLGALVEARSVRVFLEACFSGGSHAGGLIGSASPVFVEAAMPAGVDEKVMALAAATGQQVASWDEEAKHGLFTHHLLDALYGAGDVDGDGTVTALEAKGYLDRHMTRAARRAHRRVQNASLMGAQQVVLATASEGGGGLPPRPALDGDEAVLAEKAQAEIEPPPSQEAREQVASSPGKETPLETLLGDPEATERALGLNRARRVQVQLGLAALGFDTGPADGLFVGGTREAIAAWQKAKGLPETGYLNAVQAETLEVLGDEYVREKAETSQRDDEAFARAQGRGTVAAYEEYLASWPTGRHATEARRRRDELSQTRRVGEKFRDCRECPAMVVVPAGSFRMGSPPHEKARRYNEGPLHQVTIAKPFAVGAYEVTFSQWDACARAGGCNRYSPSGNGWGRGSRPVINVNWEDAQAYVQWLSRRTGKPYRLLSEAEWEYAARAGTRTPFHFGVTIGTHQANYDGTRIYGYGRKGRFRGKTLSAGLFAPNRFGLHDVHGNVWEWVQDCYNSSYSGVPIDGGASKQGQCSRRIRRGGSWADWPSSLRSASRSGPFANSRHATTGFRVARALTP